MESFSARHIIDSIEVMPVRHLTLWFISQSGEVVHSELDQVFALYPEEELLTVFVVVEPGGHRIRRLVPSP